MFHERIGKDEDEEVTKIGGLTVWAIGVGSAMGGVFFGWQFVMYGGFVCGILAVLYAATFYLLYAQVITELSMRYRSTGGSFDFVLEALGIRASVVVAILNIMKLICGNAATVLAISSYLIQGGLPSHYRYLVWIAIYGFFTTLDCIGIKQSASAQVLATTLCIAIVCFFVLSCFFEFHSSYLIVIPTAASKFSSAYLFFTGLPFAVQFFDGFEEMPLLYSYVKNAEETMPRAIIGCYITILLIAVSVLIAAAGSTDAETLLDSTAPLMVGIEQLYGVGSWISNLMAYLIVVGLLVNFFAFIVFTSQQIQAVAEANLLPRVLTYRDTVYGAPVVASLCAMIVGLTVTFSFAILLGDTDAQDTLLMASIFPSMICYLFVLQCVVALRKIEENIEIYASHNMRSTLHRLGTAPPVAFYVNQGTLRARIAQVMCFILILGLLCLALTSFDYLYGLLVFAALGITSYIAMVRQAKANIREEEASMRAEEEHFKHILVSKVHQSPLRGERVGGRYGSNANRKSDAVNTPAAQTASSSSHRRATSSGTLFDDEEDDYDEEEGAEIVPAAADKVGFVYSSDDQDVMGGANYAEDDNEEEEDDDDDFYGDHRALLAKSHARNVAKATVIPASRRQGRKAQNDPGSNVTSESYQSIR